MTITEKHAGESIGHLEHIDSVGRKWHMGPVAQRIFDALTERPYGLRARQLADIVYADDPEGGPNWAETGIVVRIRHMNRRWEQHGIGLRIRSRGHWGYQIWIGR